MAQHPASKAGAFLGCLLRRNIFSKRWLSTRAPLYRKATPMIVALFDSPTQILIVLVIALLLFGASRIPDTMRNLGKGVSEFKKGLREGEEELRKAEKDKADSAAKS